MPGPSVLHSHHSFLMPGQSPSTGPGTRAAEREEVLSVTFYLSLPPIPVQSSISLSVCLSLSPSIHTDTNTHAHMPPGESGIQHPRDPQAISDGRGRGKAAPLA